MNDIDRAARRYKALMARLWKCVCGHAQPFRAIYDNHMRCTGCSRSAMGTSINPIGELTE